MRRKTGGTRKKASTKTPARKHHRKRRISGVNDIGGMLQKAGGLVIGAVGGRELNTIAVKMFPSLTPLMSGIMQMAVGYALPKFVKGAFIEHMGSGMIANGGMVAIVATGVISGSNDRIAYRINGTSNLKVINGTSHLPVVNGVGQNYQVSGPTTRVSNVPTGPANSITPPRRRFNNYV